MLLFPKFCVTLKNSLYYFRDFKNIYWNARRDSGKNTCDLPLRLSFKLKDIMGCTHLKGGIQWELKLNESEFEEMSKYFNLDRFDRCVSLMTPLKLFEERNKIARLESWLIVYGNGPLNWLWVRSSAGNETSLVISNSGCDPFNWLKLRSSTAREGKGTNDFGSGPTTLVFWSKKNQGSGSPIKSMKQLK